MSPLNSRGGHTRIAQITILIGVLLFGSGMFFWLFNTQYEYAWRGIVGGGISLIICLLLAAVFNLEVRDDGPRVKDLLRNNDRAYAMPPGQEPMPQDDPNVIRRHADTYADPPTERVFIAPPPDETQEWTPPLNPPPDQHKKKDPFAP